MTNTELIDKNSNSSVLKLRCEPLDIVRIGFIGVGARGQRAVERMMNIEGVDIVALCDFIDENIEASCAIIAKYGKEKPITVLGEEGWCSLCEREDIDLIYIYVPTGLATQILQPTPWSTASTLPWRCRPQCR